MGARFVFCHDTVTKHLKNDLSTDLANVSSKIYIKTALEKLSRLLVSTLGFTHTLLVQLISHKAMPSEYNLL